MFDLLGYPVKGWSYQAGNQTLGDIKNKMTYSKKQGQ